MSLSIIHVSLFISCFFLCNMCKMDGWMDRSFISTSSFFPSQISVLATIIVFHFAIFIATGVVVGTHTDIDIMQFFCQLFYMLWGLVLFCSYVAVFRRLVQQAVKRQDNATSEPGTKHYNGGTKVKAKSKFTLSLAVKVSYFLCEVSVADSNITLTTCYFHYYRLTVFLFCFHISAGTQFTIKSAKW